MELDGYSRPTCNKLCASSSFHLVVSIQYHLVTDGRTDERTQDDCIYRASIASRGKNCGYVDLHMHMFYRVNQEQLKAPVATWFVFHHLIVSDIQRKWKWLFVRLEATHFGVFAQPVLNLSLALTHSVSVLSVSWLNHITLNPTNDSCQQVRPNPTQPMDGPSLFPSSLWRLSVVNCCVNWKTGFVCV